jgi:DNA-binding PadR family transcriptional regulator
MTTVLDALIEALAEGDEGLEEALAAARDRVQNLLPGGSIEPVLDELAAEELIERRYEESAQPDGSTRTDLVAITITDKGRQFHEDHPPSGSEEDLP